MDYLETELQEPRKGVRTMANGGTHKPQPKPKGEKATTNKPAEPKK